MPCSTCNRLRAPCNAIHIQAALSICFKTVYKKLKMILLVLLDLMWLDIFSGPSVAPQASPELAEQ